jgi:predicted HAD superfamily Cof-like phosphohydrolase
MRRRDSMTPLEMVREFAIKMNQPLDHPWMYGDGYDIHLESLRFSLVSEEFLEFEAAKDKENLLKELADLVYVTYGYAATFGLDLDEAVSRIHISNLSKLDDDGKPVKNDVGKVVKGPNYKPPYLGDLL